MNSIKTQSNSPIVGQMFEAGAHFGYDKSRRHPSVSKFIFGRKENFEIFDLEKSAEKLQIAKDYAKKVGTEGRQILFVGGKKEAQNAIKLGAEKIDMPYVDGRWIGGTLTNFEEIRKRIKIDKAIIANDKKTIEKANEEIVFVQPTIETENINVLVVEDVPINQLLMKTILDDFGFQRTIAANGKIAIQLLKEKQFDIILMDLQMPEMNGFEATEYIRNTLKSTIPIIALTADVTTVDVAKCKAAGMNDYMSKPLDERILYTKIMEFVKHPPTYDFHAELGNQEERKQDFIINLQYLSNHTKSNPKMMKEIILAFLEQTPTLILLIKKSMMEKDWITLNAAVHKMIPSLAIVGMDKSYEKMAKKLQEYALLQEQNSNISDIVVKLEDACTIACKELKVEYNRINSTKK
jgi:CheY-like chemotaxis protein